MKTKMFKILFLLGIFLYPSNGYPQESDQDELALAKTYMFANEAEPTIQKVYSHLLQNNGIDSNTLTEKQKTKISELLLDVIKKIPEKLPIQSCVDANHGVVYGEDYPTVQIAVFARAARDFKLSSMLSPLLDYINLRLNDGRTFLFSDRILKFLPGTFSFNELQRHEILNYPVVDLAISLGPDGVETLIAKLESYTNVELFPNRKDGLEAIMVVTVLGELNKAGFIQKKQEEHILKIINGWKPVSFIPDVANLVWSLQVPFGEHGILMGFYEHYGKDTAIQKMKNMLDKQK